MKDEPVRPKVGDLLLWSQPEQYLWVGMRVTEFRATEIVGDATDTRHPIELRWDPAGLFDGRIVAAKKCTACAPPEPCDQCHWQRVVKQSALDVAAEELGALLRASAVDFLAVGTSIDPPTIHVYWKRKQRHVLLRKHDGCAGFRVKHHVSGAARPIRGGYGRPE